MYAYMESFNNHLYPIFVEGLSEYILEIFTHSKTAFNGDKFGDYEKKRPH